MDFFKDALVEVDEAIDAADDAVKRLVVANNRLVVANNRLKELRIVLLTKLRPKEQGLTLLSLPPEIRNMIYRYVMIEPFQGHLKCAYDYNVDTSKFDLLPLDWRRLELRLFRVSRQVYAEASSLFYGENTFIVADQQRHSRSRFLGAQLSGRLSKINASRIAKLHITNRDCKWLSNPLRTSPGVYREASRKHISVVAEALRGRPHNLEYLLIDCLSGFASSPRMVMNLLKPFHYMTGIKKVHIVSTDQDHFPYLRYLEKAMTGHTIMYFGKTPDGFWLYGGYKEDKDDPKQAKAGNELAEILKVKPCYPPSGCTGRL